MTALKIPTDTAVSIGGWADADCTQGHNFNGARQLHKSKRREQLLYGLYHQ